MKLDRDVGAFYDTLAYFTFVCNKEKIYEEYAANEIKALDYPIIEKRIAEIDNEIGRLPSYFSVLFSYELNGDRYSFIGDWTSQNDLCTLEKILSAWDHQDRVLEGLIDYYFPNIKARTRNLMTERDVESWYVEAEKAGLSDRITLGLIYVCSNFESVQEGFQRLFSRVYRAIKTLHVKEATLIEETFERLGREDVKERMEKLKIIDESDDDFPVCVGLLRPYCIMVRGADQMNLLLVGDQFERCFLHMEGKSTQSGYTDFALICGSKNRMDIICALAEGREKTMSQMSRELNMQIPLILRHLNALEDAKIIYRARREGRNIFYALDKTTLQSVQRSAGEFFNRLLKG